MVSIKILNCALAIIGLAGLVIAFLVVSNTSSTETISGDEPVKQKATYTIERERSYQLERYGGATEDRIVKETWDVWAVSGFQLNDGIIVDYFYFSPVIDAFMDEWMSYEYQSGASRADRLFIEGVERVLIDVPGCPLILTTDQPYERLAEYNWWSFLVEVDRQDTYERDMSRCHRSIKEYAAFELGWISVLILELSYLTGLMRNVLEVPLWTSIATPTPTPTATPEPTPALTPEPMQTVTPEPTTTSVVEEH